MAAATSKNRFISGFGFQVLIAMVIGLGLGLLARELGPEKGQAGFVLAETLRQIGSIFVQLLRTLVPPLVFTAIVASIANLAELQNAARLVWRTLFWFAVTALIAVLIGITLGLVLQPGLHTTVAAAEAHAPKTNGSWLDFLIGLVPSNVLGLTASTTIGDTGAAKTSLSFNVLQILVISLVTGVAALKAGEAGKGFLAFNASALVVVRKVLSWVIRLTPIGTIGLLGNAVAQYGWTTLGQLGAFTGAIYVGLALVLFVVYPILLAANGLNPVKFFAGAWPAIQLGFVSRSSVGTLPVTEAVTEHSLGVPRAYSAFAVPLGATTKMDGCAAIYPAISAIFVAQFFGLHLGPRLRLSSLADRLPAQMTIEEKAGQLSCYSDMIRPPVGDINPLVNQRNTQQILADIKAGRIGVLMNGVGVEGALLAQTAAVEGSRLRIPLLFAADVIHGFKTIYPIPLGESASFDPHLAERTARARRRGLVLRQPLDLRADGRRGPRPALGPGAEGSGEDVFLGEVMAQARVRGFQGRDLRDARQPASPPPSTSPPMAR
jgi:Na+/H+-dicarboxylate symporter